MGKHLTPTQKRLVETAHNVGEVEVRITRKHIPGSIFPIELNAYEAAALQDLHELGLLKIVRKYERTSADQKHVVGVTYVARPPR